VSRLDQDEESTRNMWSRLGLGAAKLQISYPSAEEAVEAVLFLMSHGHGHHFAVVGEGRTLVLSQLAADCLLDRDQDRARAENARRAASDRSGARKRGPSGAG